MEKKIVIIGAGPSGIAAATKLIENGFNNVLILEAENRIGGRINTIPFGANVIDMGAQWLKNTRQIAISDQRTDRHFYPRLLQNLLKECIKLTQTNFAPDVVLPSIRCHGEQNNCVYQLAKDHNLLEPTDPAPAESDTNLVQSDGTIVPREHSRKLMALWKEITSNYETEMRTYNGALGNFFMEKYNEAMKTDKFSDIDENVRHQFPFLVEKLQNGWDGTDTWYDTSTNSYNDYEETIGDYSLNWKDKGYITVLGLLQKKIPQNYANPIEIENYAKFGKEVKKIVYADSSAVRIECNDKSMYTADHVICTVSLGVLQECHLQLFEPILPQRKIDAIEGLFFGTVDKMYMEFEQPFWPSDWTGVAILWNVEQLKIIRDSDETRWMEDVSGIFIVSQYQPNLVCGWISGERARQMERLPFEMVANRWMLLLKMIFPQVALPDRPKNMRGSAWHSNPHFRGSYSSVSLKSNGMNATHANLANPICTATGSKPILQFAGEATHERYYSTVHGAVESGWREAQRLIDFYKSTV